MNCFPGTSSSRREFFRGAARYVLLSGLAALAVLGVARRCPGGQTCVNRGLCRGCTEFEDCELPAALSAKLTKPGTAYDAHRENS